MRRPRTLSPLLAAGFFAAAACGTAPEQHPAATGPAARIVSLDYCADQYVLALADRERVLALSPDAGGEFSYLQDEAAGLPSVRPRAEDVLGLQPDLVVRSYGGGPRAGAFFERAGVAVLQLDFAPDVAAVRGRIRRAAAALGIPARGEALIGDMDARLARARAQSKGGAALYLAPAGVSAGSGTFVHHLLEEAGLANFDDGRGWRAIPLERLAYEAPDVYVTPRFDRADQNVVWTPFRHPLAVRRVQAGPTISLDGATTSCGGWFLADAVEALAAGAAASGDGPS